MNNNEQDPGANHQPLQVGSLHRVVIEKLAWGGEGLARLGTAVCFVDGGLPGDVVEIRLETAKKNYFRGSVARLIQPAAGRRTAPCPYFGSCGGCQLQDITYETQLRAKELMLGDILRSILAAADARLLPIVHSPKEWGYRMRVRWHTGIVNETMRIGYFHRKSHELTPIDQCLLLEPLLNQCLEGLNQKLPKLARKGIVFDEIRALADDSQQTLALVCRQISDRSADAHSILSLIQGAGVPVSGLMVQHYGRVTKAAKTWVTLQSHGISYRAAADSFTQVNRPLHETMQTKVVELLAPRPQERIIEFYSGIGFFSLMLAQKAQSVTGIEVSQSATASAHETALRAGIHNVRFEAMKSETFVGPSPHDFDSVVLDPPRTGCHPAVLDWIIRQRLAKVLYISCEPVMMVRDLKRLLANGYQLICIQPFDLFPQTYHLECMALLRKS